MARSRALHIRGRRYDCSRIRAQPSRGVYEERSARKIRLTEGSRYALLGGCYSDHSSFWVRALRLARLAVPGLARRVLIALKLGFVSRLGGRALAFSGPCVIQTTG